MKLYVAYRTAANFAALSNCRIWRRYYLGGTSTIRQRAYQVKPPQPASADPVNRHQFRESWLRAATNDLRPYFASAGYQVPENIRFAIAFTSTGRHGNRRSESWHASADNTYEIFIRADIADPVEVLSLLATELVHTVVPDEAGHGRLFRDAALKVGLLPPMRQPVPAPHLVERLQKVADALGELPHAKLEFIKRDPLLAVTPAKASPSAVPLNGQKKQTTRMLKAECRHPDCGFVVRVSSGNVQDIGPPHCPKHGEMAVEIPAEERMEEPPLLRAINAASADNAAKQSAVADKASGTRAGNGASPAPAS